VGLGHGHHLIACKAVSFNLQCGVRPKIFQLVTPKAMEILLEVLVRQAPPELSVVRLGQILYCLLCLVIESCDKTVAWAVSLPA